MILYWSVDIEADGPVPGANSMLSLAAVPFTKNYIFHDEAFYRKLLPLPEASADPNTMLWWETQPEAWEEVQKDQEQPYQVLQDLHSIVKARENGGLGTMVGYPVAYDFMFIQWYFLTILGSSPFSHGAIDIKSYAACMLKTSYKKAVKKNMPKNWFGKTKHTHKAIDDAIGQAELFQNMLKELDRDYV